MIAIRTYGWSVLVLAALSGCGNTGPEPTTPPPTTDTTTPAPETTPPVTTPPVTTPGEMKAEPTGTAPVELPKVEGPAIEAPQPTPAPKEEVKPEAAAAAAVSLTGEEVAEIKKLAGGEAVQALKQVLCPVSGENLGSMGVPIKVSAEGQSFYLCCKGCSKEVTDDPKGVVAKLKK